MPLYLVGHGGWNVINSAFPYAKVPRGTSISFYTENAKLLGVTTAPEIAKLAAADALGESNGTFEQYKPVPNYTLSPLDDYTRWFYGEVIPGCVPVDVDTPLCTGEGDDGPCIESDDPLHTCTGLFATYAGQEIVWLACRAMMLRPAGGAAAGVNTLQAEIGTDPSTESADWTNEAWSYFSTASPDDFWTWFVSLDEDQRMTVMAWHQVADRFVSEGRDLASI